MELKFKDLKEGKLYASEGCQYTIKNGLLFVDDEDNDYSVNSMRHVAGMIFTEIVKLVEPEVIETMWFRCINNIDWDFESENHMYAKGEIVCSETWMMPTGCWQEVKPINESCTMFEVCNE